MLTVIDPCIYKAIQVPYMHGSAISGLHCTFFDSLSVNIGIKHGFYALTLARFRGRRKNRERRLPIDLANVDL